MNQDLRRSLMLQELGLMPLWQRKALPSTEPAPQEIGDGQLAAADMPDSSTSITEVPDRASMEARQALAQPVLDAEAPLGKEALTVADGAPAMPIAATVADAGDIASMNWHQLQQAVASCRACGLSRQRSQTVLGSGALDASCLLVGDSPDSEDESTGSAFSGQAGQLLDNMLQTVGLGRKQNVYLTTLVKCRAQDEAGQARPPQADEIAACRPFLQRQIALLQPKLVISLGKVAAQALRQPSAGPLRGVAQRLAQDLPVNSTTALVATWHPAIVLQQPLEKRQVWADLCLAKNTLDAAQPGTLADDDIPF